MSYSIDTPATIAARWVPNNPRLLCRDFTPKAPPAAFWCAHCGWNKPMHTDENVRAAIAAALACIQSQPADGGA